MSPRLRGGAGLGRAGSRSPEHRVGNRTFYVVAEGEGTEHDYFGRLNTAYGADLKFLIKTPPPATQRDGLPPSRVVDEARYGLAEPGIDEVWGLFDHDGRPDIDQVCSRANRERVNVALSHPSFDLWLLLHFQDFPPAAQHGKNRLIIEKLRTAHPAFAEYGKRNKRISKPRFEALTEGDGIRQAVRRARTLSRQFARETPSNRDPSTDAYLLIEALGIVSRPQ